MTVPGQPRQKSRPYLKITNAKRNTGETPVVKHLPSKCKALSSNLITQKIK
jgi:hypothetical protein